MVYNIRTTFYTAWVDNLKRVAIDEYNFPLDYDFEGDKLLAMYHSGMDIHEALQELQEQDSTLTDIAD